MRKSYIIKYNLLPLQRLIYHIGLKINKNQAIYDSKN